MERKMERMISVLVAASLLTACSSAASGGGVVGAGTGSTVTADCTTAAVLDVAAYRGGGTIAAGSCHIVDKELLVDGGVLTIEAGATLQFAADVGLVVEEDGRLTVAGTASAPVMLVGKEATPGFWKGVRLRTKGAANALQHFTLAHAGSKAWSGASYATASLYATSGCGATLADCEIRDGGGHGFVAEKQSELMISGCTFSKLAAGGYVHPEVAGNLAADNAFTDNATNVVRVGFSSPDIATAAAWQDIGVPWRVEASLDVRAPLTIAPGAVVEFGQDVGVRVKGEGRLTLAGTAEAPITLTGVEAIRGYWQGIQVESRGADNVLDHVELAFAGSKQWTGAADSAAALRLEEGAGLALENTVIRQSGNYALWSDDDVLMPAFGGVRFEANAKVAALHANAVGALTADTAFVDNDEQAVRVTPASANVLSAAATWRALAVPYAVTKETRIEAALTIEAGTQLTFFQDAWLHVRDEGSLTAIGSAEAPIVFSSPAGEAVPGYWKGLGISTASTANKLDHVTIRNAGSKSWYGGDDATGALRLDNGVVAITNSTIADIAGWGIDLGSKGSVSDCSGTTFSKVSGDNVKGNPAGVCM
jgi:hypothetical protein